MIYKNNTKILIDKRKLETLLRLGCDEKIIWNYIKTGDLQATGDSLIDENLETLIDVKIFENWGGNRKGAGRKSQKTLKKNQVEIQDENQVDNQLENQDINQVVDIDIYKDNNINNNNIDNNVVNIKKKKREVFVKPEQWEVEEEYFVKTDCKKSDEEISRFAKKFINFYESKGWKVGKSPMKDWRACVRTWILNDEK